MKTKVFVMSCLIVSATVLAAGSLWAQDATGATPPPPPPGDNAGMAPPPDGGPNGGPGSMGPDPAKMDVNGNGLIDASEFSNGWSKATENRFKKLDTNGDGTLSMEEFEKAPHPGGGPRGKGKGPDGADPRGMEKGLDNGAGPPPPPPSGEVKGQCPPEGMANGQRPPEGMANGQRPPKRPPFPGRVECDINKDGIVSEAEFLTANQQAALERFKELDTDNDGSVTVEQLKSARGPMGGPRGQMGGPGGPRGGSNPDGPRP